MTTTAQDVVATLFFVEAPRAEDDPPSVESRGCVVYGEGLTRSEPLSPKTHVFKDQAGVRRLHFTGSLNELRDALQLPVWDHPGGKLRLVMGLVARPALIALPHASLLGPGHDAGLLPPAQVGSLILPFVCINKGGLAHAVVAARGGHEPAAAALDRVAQLTGRELRGRDVAMFGDVYIAEKRSTRMRKISWAALRDEPGRAPLLRVRIDESQVTSEVVVNVRLYGPDLVPSEDICFVWRPGDPSERMLESNQPIGGACLRAWQDGRLIAEEAYPLLRMVGLTGQVGGGGLTLQDKLTAETQKAAKDGRASANAVKTVSTVSRSTPIRTTVQLDEGGPWAYVRFSAATDVHRHIRPIFDADAYFPAGPEGRAMAVVSLAEKISAARESLLIDPYVDADGGLALLARLSNLGAKLTIVTWLQNEAGPVSQLRQGLLKLKQERLLADSIEVWHVPTNKQPFHDRTLLLDSDDDSSVFTLSNSLSGAARQYPLIITKLTAGTAWAVAADARQLVEGVKIQGVRLWPDAVQARATDVGEPALPRRGELFDGWQEAIALALDRNDLTTDEAALDAACGANIMSRDQVRGEAHWQLRPAPLAITERLKSKLFDRLSDRTKAGTATRILGEIDARGLETTADEVAAELTRTIAKEAAIVAITTTLRDGYQPPQASRDSNFAAACFQSGATRQIVQAAFHAWTGRLQQLEWWYRDWGREFAYSVLGELSPTAVVGVMEELRDLAPIASATGFYRDRIADFRPISRALTQSKSAFMRAFGAQSYFVPWMRAHGANHITAPEDVKGAIADLEQLGLPHAELALFVEAWTRDWDDDGTRQAVVNCLRDMLCDERTSRELRADVLLNCLSQGRSVVPLLFVDMDGLPEAKARILSRSVLDVLLQWIPVSESERPGRSFYSGYVDICQAIAKAAGVIAAADSGTPGDVLRAAMDESKLLKLSQSVSPLVPRPGRIAAVSARGWLAICALLAAAELPDRGLLRAEVENATGLIDEFGSDLDQEMRAALTKTLASAKQLLVENKI